MDASLAREVRERAGHVCEYCRMPQSYYPTVPFPIDHIIARQHGGATTLDNLALSCLHDNTHKGPNIAGIDPLTRRITRLFNPRRDKWHAPLRVGWRLTYRQDRRRSDDDRRSCDESSRCRRRTPVLDRGRLFPPKL